MTKATERNIAHRGKRKDNGAWCDGDLVRIRDGKTEHWYIYGKSLVDPDTVGQLTTITDNEINDIFEGDIVEYNDGIYYFKGVITFAAGAFGIACKDTVPLEIANACGNDNFISLWELLWNQEDPGLTSLDYVRVIGNIYDNSELLEARNNA